MNGTPAPLPSEPFPSAPLPPAPLARDLASRPAPPPTTWGDAPHLIAAAALVLVASPLAEALVQTFHASPGGTFLLARGAALASMLLVTLLLPRLRAVAPFAALLLAAQLLQALVGRIDFTLPAVAAALGGGRFITQMQPQQTGKVAVALGLILMMALLGFSRRAMFLVRGDPRARIAPVPWLGFPRPDRWTSFGGQYGVYLAAGVAAALWFAAPPAPGALGRWLAALPAVLLMAACNAFNEEILYRNAVLAPLEPVLGRRGAWAASVAAFGLAHFYGVPGGWLGMGLAGFVGWLLAKAMLETRGVFWSWWMHWLLDVAIFSFMAMAA